MRPEEIIDLRTCFTKLELFDQACHIACQLRQAAENPAIRQRDWLQLADSWNASADLSSGHQDETRSIPDFVGEVAIAYDAFKDEFHVIARRAAGSKSKAQGVCAILIHDIEGINNVIIRFAHLLAFGVTYQSMQVDGMERNGTHEVNTGHYHTRNPEKDDVVARLNHRCWVIAQQVSCDLRPAKRAECPQPRTEPGI